MFSNETNTDAYVPMSTGRKVPVFTVYQVRIFPHLGQVFSADSIKYRLEKLLKRSVFTHWDRRQIALIEHTGFLWATFH